VNKVLLCALLLATSLAHSQIYRTTDKHGNVVFTDTPPADGAASEKVELKPTNTAPPPVAVPRPEPAAPEEEASTPPQATITNPDNETTIAMGPGNFSVSASVQPALSGGQRLQLNMDGAPYGESQTNASWALTNVFRGAHDLTVSVLDEDGQVLTTSDPVRVYVLRPSVNFRN
jgi:hypothetical protein